MTTQDKIKYIQTFMKLVVDAKTYRDACAHSNFVRGMLAAYSADTTITMETYRQFNEDIEVVMEVKRKLKVKGDTL